MTPPPPSHKPTAPPLPPTLPPWEPGALEGLPLYGPDTGFATWEDVAAGRAEPPLEIGFDPCGCCDINDFEELTSENSGPDDVLGSCANCGHSPEEHGL